MTASASVPPGTAGIDALGLVTELVPLRYTTPLLDAKTDGRQIVWSSGARSPVADSAPDLFRFVPGSVSPTPIFTNPNRDSQLVNIVMDGEAGYAFIEQNEHLWGAAGWRVWYLPSAGARPTLVDQNDATGDAQSPIPFLAFTSGHVIWTAVHHRAGGLRFELLSYDIATRTDHVIASSDPDVTEYWFPSSDGSARLVYATVEHIGGDTVFHAYLLDLSRMDARPQRLDKDGQSTMPLLSGDRVVWKNVGRNVFEWGQLERRSLTEAKALHSISRPRPGSTIPAPAGDSSLAGGWTTPISSSTI
ncbi:MAG: hypothetical protein ACRDGL_04485 [Candidatus Limnocylindrales bacterium]